jgi:hypothetical protein
MAKGWKLEPGRHALAARGVPTGRRQRRSGRRGSDRMAGERTVRGIGTAIGLLAAATIAEGMIKGARRRRRKEQKRSKKRRR